jgi:hypothetical protein
VTGHQFLPPAADIVAEMDRAVMADKTAALEWATGGLGWATLIVDLIESNLRQWDLEDRTRDPGASDSEVAWAKREIDQLNSGRHHLVQEIDAIIDRILLQSPAAPLATESPGMVLDRLSVLVIRRSRTAAAISRDPALADRVVALESQIGALCEALDGYVEELQTGRRRFLRYESLKLYRPSDSVADSLKE